MKRGAFVCLVPNVTIAILCCVGLAALKYLDLGLGTRPEWAHSIAGTDKQLFSAPLTQRKWLLSFSSSLVCDLADFLWAQLADGVPGSVTTTPQYTMSFIKEACPALFRSAQCCVNIFLVNGNTHENTLAF